MAKAIKVGEINNWWQVSVTPEDYKLTLEFTQMKEAKKEGLPSWKSLSSKKPKKAPEVTGDKLSFAPNFLKVWGLDKAAPFNEKTPLAADKSEHRYDKIHFDSLTLEMEPNGYGNILGFVEVDGDDMLELVERGISIEDAYRVIARALAIPHSEIARVLNAAIEALHENGSKSALQGEFILKSSYYNPWVSSER